LLRLYFTIFKNIILSFNIAKIPLLFKPRTMISVIQVELFNLKTLAQKRKILHKEAYDVLNDGEANNIKISIHCPNKWFRTDSSYLKDLISLFIICQKIEAKSIFEIGTLGGLTAYHFAINTSEDARIYTLDLPEKQNSFPELKTTYVDRMHIDCYKKIQKMMFSGKKEENKINRLFGDSNSFDFSLYYGKIDFFFIDGSHSYEYVKSDTENALKCVRSGGIIAWHDYGRAGTNGITKYLHEIAARYSIYSVPGSSIAFMIV